MVDGNVMATGVFTLAGVAIAGGLSAVTASLTRRDEADRQLRDRLRTDRLEVYPQLIAVATEMHWWCGAVVAGVRRGAIESRVARTFGDFLGWLPDDGRALFVGLNQTRQKTLLVSGADVALRSADVVVGSGSLIMAAYADVDFEAHERQYLAYVELMLTAITAEVSVA